MDSNDVVLLSWYVQVKSLQHTGYAQQIDEMASTYHKSDATAMLSTRLLNLLDLFVTHYHHHQLFTYTRPYPRLTSLFSGR